MDKIHASALNKYVTTVIKTLWTDTELANKLITESNKTSSGKVKMDLTRLLLLEGLIINKKQHKKKSYKILI